MKKYLFFFIAIMMILAGCTVSKINMKETPKKLDYLGAPDVVLFDNTTVTVNPDGSFDATQHKAVKLFNLKGRKRYSSLSETYYTEYSNVKYNYIRIYKPDGKVIKVSKKKIKDMPYPAFGKFFLPKLHIKKVELPELENNCVVEWSVITTMSNPPMKDNYWDMTMFQGYEPYIKKEYNITFPKAMDIKYELKNNNDTIKVLKIEKGNNITLSFTAENVEKIKYEPYMPQVVNVAPRLILSSLKNWKEMSKWAASIAEPNMKITDKVKVKVEELTKDKANLHDKMFAIYRFVTDKVRYVETNMVGKKGGFKPYDADYILDKMYGVCRDKAALLVTMFRSLGIDAYWVLTNPMTKIDTDMTLNIFNHAIVAIKTDKGYTFLDPTAEKTDMVFPEMEKDKYALICTKEGEDLINTGKFDANINQILVDMLININKKLVSNVEFKMTATGDVASQFRMMSAMFNDEVKKQLFQSFATQLSKDAVVDLKNSDIIVPDDFKKPVIMKVLFKSKNLLKKTGKYYKFDMGDTNKFSNNSYFNLSERKYPVKIDMGMVTGGNVVIIYPRFLKVDTAPDAYSYKSNIMNITNKVSNKRSKLSIDSKVILSPGIIPVKDYKSEKERFEEFSKKNSDILFVRKYR
ncbi:DUF3857 domain-containing protein [bacterium]|nr:DUF3857 domain-containing protein [bacterium]